MRIAIRTTGTVRAIVATAAIAATATAKTVKARVKAMMRRGRRMKILIIRLEVHFIRRNEDSRRVLMHITRVLLDSFQQMDRGR